MSARTEAWATVNQTKRIVQLTIDLLNKSDQQLLIQQIIEDYGVQEMVPKVFSDKELAERYDVDVRTARKWIVNGKIKGFKNDGRWYTRADWIDEFERSCIS